MRIAWHNINCYNFITDELIFLIFRRNILHKTYSIVGIPGWMLIRILLDKVIVEMIRGARFNAQICMCKWREHFKCGVRMWYVTEKRQNAKRFCWHLWETCTFNTTLTKYGWASEHCCAQSRFICSDFCLCLLSSFQSFNDKMKLNGWWVMFFAAASSSATC